MNTMDTDVLIVGAGPTGLMLANQLTRRGVRVMIVERNAGPSRQTRALGVQARTLEIYAHLGIDEQAVALGKRGDGAQLWAQGRRTARVPLIDAGSDQTPYPYLLVLGQDDNERLLGERLAAGGHTVHWNTELVALVSHPDHAEATLAEADGTTRTVRARWVAGCDGHRSRVRELNGVAFPGAPYEHVFFVADVRARGAMVPDELNVFLWRDGFHLFFPMRGEHHWRIVGILPPALRGADGLTFEQVMPSLAGRTGLDLEIDGCDWFSTYRIHHRHAARFSAGRSFLLGDAAHVHSPVGAQGMNTGLQDAYNLAWKLALVVHGRADAGLLDTYERERLPVARRLLDTTDRGFRLVVSDHPIAGVLRTKVLARIAAAVMRRPRIQRAAFRTVSQIGIHYRNGPLAHAVSHLPPDAPQPGDRFPWLRLAMQPSHAPVDLYRHLDDLHFHLLVVGQPAPDIAGYEDVLRIHAIPAEDNRDACARAHIPLPSFFLLRPDGHVGCSGRRLAQDDVVAYLERHVRLRPGSCAPAMAR